MIYEVHETLTVRWIGPAITYLGSTYIYRLILHPHQPRAWNKYVSDLNSECSVLTDVFKVRFSQHCKSLVRNMQHF